VLGKSRADENDTLGKTCRVPPACLHGYVQQPVFLLDLFEKHRGRRYEDLLSFPVLVERIADILAERASCHLLPGLLA